ncbi:MAG: hypothetical protein EOM91_16625 [Sphingobacteriia bacterium]|nr:hypothetical protein [Sphingobacteriia bacterium]
MTENRANPEELVFNGINGETGGYALPPMSLEELAKVIKGERKPENFAELRQRHFMEEAHPLAVAEGVDPKRLDETGWGLILPSDADPAIQEALEPLLALRREQAGDLFKVYGNTSTEAGRREGHLSGETKGEWLARAPRSMSFGPVVPHKCPYYLLICADPERTDYRFQAELDVSYAVGRIHFDNIDCYAHYAETVVRAEREAEARRRRLSFFGVANPDDAATDASLIHLVQPLMTALDGKFPGWDIDASNAQQATKARLLDLLGGDATPSLLFTASHGMEFPKKSPLQVPHQGALLCQNWPGPWSHQGPIPEDWYLAGEHLPSRADLGGMIAFFFACFGGGTPLMDAFYRQAFSEPKAIAEKRFIAGLPKRMLGLKRGALAVIGHVERAWSYSFHWPSAGYEQEVFRSTLHRLLTGYPVGAAIEPLNALHAELSTSLTTLLEQIDRGTVREDPVDLARLWTANNDARGYSIIGDPAVKLPAAAASGI